MTISENFTKHYNQIKKGGILVILKKLRSTIYLILQIPIYFISIPTVIIVRIIRPWFLIRWKELTSSRIGHFSINTEIYCCERDAGINFPSQRYVDLFYLKKNVCNNQLEKMWRRSLIILPNYLLFPLFKVNRFFNTFISGGNYHEIEPSSTDGDRDVHNLFEKFQPHISFTQDEEVKGRKILSKFGLPHDAKFVCLIVRDSAYLDRHKEIRIKDWNYHNYRDEDIDKYVLAAEELARRDYYIFRMGAKVLKPLKSSNPKVIDYANSGKRSDFMDIYLGAKCSFCISTSGAGFFAIPYIFRKPNAFTFVPIGYFFCNNSNHIMITKHHIHRKYKKRLTVSEIFSSNVALCSSSADFELNGIKLEDNSPKEIRDLVVEMDERINGNYKETNEDRMLQKRFWSTYEENMKRLNLKKPIHGKIKARFGAKFLRENKNWIM